MIHEVTWCEIIKSGTSVIYKVSKNSKERVGKVRDFRLTSKGIRYKLYRKEAGRFLNGETLWEALSKKQVTIKDTRWVFFMWIKPKRIIKIL